MKGLNKGLAVGLLLSAATSVSGATLNVTCVGATQNTLCSFAPEPEGVQCQDLNTYRTNGACYTPMTADEECRERYVKVFSEKKLDCNPPVAL